MHKSIITSIAKKAEITWHPSTQNLYKSFLDAYDNAFLETVIHTLKDSSLWNQQTLFFTSNRVIVADLNKHIDGKDEKHPIDYVVVAGCFNPWFDIEMINRRNTSSTFIELSPKDSQSDEEFDKALSEFIFLDYMKSLSQANMTKIGNNFFGLREFIKTHPHIESIYVELIGSKLSADGFASYLNKQRDFVYKHRVTP